MSIQPGEQVEITVPTVHRNGTDGEALRRGYCEAMATLRSAIEAATMVYPNGRDYYVQGPGAIRRAMKEHEARLGRLQSVLEEWQHLAKGVYSQMNGKENGHE